MPDLKKEKEEAYNGAGAGNFRDTVEQHSRVEIIARNTIEELCRGDHKAFDKIYSFYVSSLINFLHTLLQSHEEAKEVAQETFIYLWQNRNKIDPERNLKTYLYNYAKFCAFNILEHRKVKDKYADIHIRTSNKLDHSPDDFIIREETSSLIQASLKEMPKQQRKVFEMSRFEGLSLDEIAGELEISKKTVKAHMYNALKTLKKVIMSPE